MKYAILREVWEVFTTNPLSILWIQPWSEGVRTLWGCKFSRLAMVLFLQGIIALIDIRSSKLLNGFLV
jgi:hypothetical protein